jgi:hypothetical protein
MQQELDETGYSVEILGINAAGKENGNPTITEGRSLPWLQDTEEVNAWDLWSVDYRDVYVLDQQHQLRYIYNLTTQNLGEAEYYQDLLRVLQELHPSE